MPSEETCVGSFMASDMRSIEVIRLEDGGVMLFEPHYAYGWEIIPAERDRLAELLQRAAMPGQPVAEVPAMACACCKECCDHQPGDPPHDTPCGHDCRVGPHPLTVAVDPALAERTGEIADAAQEADLPADWTPPPRSLLYAKPGTPEEGGGIIIGCDCGAVTHLIIDGIERLTARQEMSFTCDGCQSVHWFTVGPVKTGEQP